MRHNPGQPTRTQRNRRTRRIRPIQQPPRDIALNILHIPARILRPRGHRIPSRRRPRRRGPDHHLIPARVGLDGPHIRPIAPAHLYRSPTRRTPRRRGPDHLTRGPASSSPSTAPSAPKIPRIPPLQQPKHGPASGRTRQRHPDPGNRHRPVRQLRLSPARTRVRIRPSTHCPRVIHPTPRRARRRRGRTLDNQTDRAKPDTRIPQRPAITQIGPSTTPAPVIRQRRRKLPRRRKHKRQLAVRCLFLLSPCRRFTRKTGEDGDGDKEDGFHHRLLVPLCLRSLTMLIPRSPTRPDMPTTKAHIQVWMKEVRSSIFLTTVSRTEKRCSFSMFWRYSWVARSLKVGEGRGGEVMDWAKAATFKRKSIMSHIEHDTKARTRMTVNWGEVRNWMILFIGVMVVIRSSGRSSRTDRIGYCRRLG